jgi:hypothetical protein
MRIIAIVCGVLALWSARAEAADTPTAHETVLCEMATESQGRPTIEPGELPSGECATPEVARAPVAVERADTELERRFAHPGPDVAAAAEGPMLGMSPPLDLERTACDVPGSGCGELVVPHTTEPGLIEPPPDLELCAPGVLCTP